MDRMKIVLLRDLIHHAIDMLERGYEKVDVLMYLRKIEEELY